MMMRKRKIIGIIGLVLILVIVLFYVVRIRPMVTEYKKIAYDKLANIDEDTFAKLENTKVYGKNGKLIGEVNSGSYQYKKISEISKYVQDGYIAVEDKNFKSHHGIDYLATVRAGIKLVLNRGKATQGGSTITQQLVKNSFLSQEKHLQERLPSFSWHRRLKRCIRSLRLWSITAIVIIMGIVVTESEMRQVIIFIKTQIN